MKLSCLAAVLFATAIAATALPASAQVAGGPPNRQIASADTEKDIRVCFYAEQGFKQRRHCTHSERRLTRIKGSWANDVESILVENARVKVCNEINFRGDCEYISSDRKLLPKTVLNNIQSYEVL